MPKRPPLHRPTWQKPPAEAKRQRRREIDERRPNAHGRGYDWNWRRLRALFLKRNPVCCVIGCGAPATEVDHILSVRERPDLRLVWTNLRSLCRYHHSSRTAKEQGFAVRRKPG